MYQWVFKNTLTLNIQDKFHFTTAISLEAKDLLEYFTADGRPISQDFHVLQNKVSRSTLVAASLIVAAPLILATFSVFLARDLAGIS